MNLNNNWLRNIDTGKWISTNDKLKKTDFDALKQDLKTLRFYQKCLSGSTYIGSNSVLKNGVIEDIYDVLGSHTHSTYYYSGPDLPYIEPFSSPLPNNPILISSTSSLQTYIDKVLPDYNMTLKNLFTPERLIKDQIDNLFYVDLATTEQIDNITDSLVGLNIDNKIVIEGHKVLVKDQYDLITLPNSTNPDAFFLSDYSIFSTSGSSITYKVPNSLNGIYVFKNKKLIRSDDIDSYSDLIRYSICVKLGSENVEKQFKLSRLSNGFFPEYYKGDPISFKESHNFVVRNRVDYNNLYELSLYDTIKEGTHSFVSLLNIGSVSISMTYSIPERAISIGEFGIILNHQENTTSIINSKYKVNLRSIDKSEKFYWICGDEGILLRVNKIDFSIDKISLLFKNFNQSSPTVITKLNSVSFFNELRGVVVGEFNQIWVTVDGGYNWDQIYIPDFDGYNYNKVIFTHINKFYVGGDNGVFIEFEYNLNKWLAHKRRISKYVDGLDDEYLLVSDINDMYYFTHNSKDFICIGCDLNNFYLYDLSHYISNNDFLYVQNNSTNNNLFGDISSITYTNGEINFSTFEGIYSSDIFNYTLDSNILSATFSIISTQSSINKIFNYKDIDKASSDSSIKFS